MTHTKNCPVFSKIWGKSDCAGKLLDRNHSYQVGTNEVPEFLRLADYDKHEPVRGLTWSGELPTKDNYQGNRTNNARTCECGKPDAWQCWQDVKNNLVLGGERVARTGRGYTVFPQDLSVNAAILGTANKFFPTSLSNSGIPLSEDFRDLCSFLALDGVRTNADGSFSTYYLALEAKAYLRKQGAIQCISDRLAQSRQQPTKDKQ
jgi:hypothetical protein